MRDFFKKRYKITISRLLQKEIIKRGCRISFFAALACVEYLATTTRQIEVIAHSWDKLNHLAAFAVLYLLLSAGFGVLQIRGKILLLMAFAVQIELVQHFIPGRDFSLADIVADGAGIAMGWWIWVSMREKLVICE